MAPAPTPGSAGRDCPCPELARQQDAQTNHSKPPQRCTGLLVAFESLAGSLPPSLSPFSATWTVVQYQEEAAEDVRQGMPTNLATLHSSSSIWELEEGTHGTIKEQEGEGMKRGAVPAEGRVRVPSEGDLYPLILSSPPPPPFVEIHLIQWYETWLSTGKETEEFPILDISVP